MEPPLNRIVRAALAASVLLVVATSSVLAHAQLDTADPGPDDVVTGSPTELVATFTQDLDMSRTSLSVRAPDGSHVADGGTVDPADPRRLTLELPELAPGEYEVRWTTFSSEDSELARGRYTFTVEAAASPTPSVAPSASDEAVASPDGSAATSPSPVTSLAPTPQPSATAAPGTPPADDSGTGVLLPIVIAGVVIGGVAAWMLRRR
jgi:methionine-rich copper-binding protein CopC